MYNNSNIYVLCPAYVATGGTEAIHTLAYELRKLGMSAIIYYTDVRRGVEPVAKPKIQSGFELTCFLTISAPLSDISS